MLKNAPTCKYHFDCFARNHGKCVILSDCNFAGTECPFYKNKELIKIENEKTRTRLLKLGLEGLITDKIMEGTNGD